MAGHLYSAEEKTAVYLKLTEQCILLFRKKEKMGDAIQILIHLMDEDYISMHNPFHHFIVPASLLTATCMVAGSTEEELRTLLHKAYCRAEYIKGGFCGEYGACGAGVGAGIYMSVYTDTTPMSEESWQWCNEITGLSLQAISGIPGPRCCKRTGFLAVRSAIPYIEKKLHLALQQPEQIVCKYYSNNRECKKQQCLFYQEQE